jgi:hypothetical protein
MSISVTDGLTARSASSAEKKFAVNRQDGENPYRHFGFGTQNETGLAAPGERCERTVVPVAHRAVLSLSKTLSLNGLRFSFSNPQN